MKFHPWHTSLTLHIHLEQPSLAPTTSTYHFSSHNTQVYISSLLQLPTCAPALDVHLLTF